MQQHIQHNSQRRGGLNKLLLHYTATMLRSRIAAALVARQAGALAYDARFRSKVDGLVARRRGDLLVVLEDCTDPANAASIARVCDGFGVPELLFVTSRRPEPAFDPCGEGLRRLSASATQWVKLTSYSLVEDCYERLRRDGFASAACVMDDDAVLLPATDDAAARRDLLGDGPLALWFGTESRGLSPAAVGGADRKVLIPMVGQVESFNLAAAAAIIVAETCRLAGPSQIPPPTNLAEVLLAQHASWHEPQRRLRRRTAAAARGEIFRQRRKADAG